MGGYGRTPYATEVHNTPQKSPRNPDVTPWLIVIHHAATQSFDAVVQMENGSKQVSSTVIIKDGRVASMFDEASRAWSLSSGYYDSVSLSSETCNSGGAAEGWPISEASYRTLAKVVAEWCRKYNIPANRERILGHKEVFTRYGASYATQCPGGIDLDRLVRMVNDILTGTSGTDQKPIPVYDENEDAVIIHTKQNGIYTAVPGAVISHPDTFLYDAIKAGYIPAKGEAPVVPWEVAGDDLSRILYMVSGCPKEEIPPVGGRWFASRSATPASVTITDADRASIAKSISAQIALPSGATKADVETIITTALGRIFR